MGEVTTLCYVEREGQYLMLHRVKKKEDINAGKWIGLGGHVEANESPDDCVLREVKEECGLSLTSFQIRGIITFCQEGRDAEYMFLYTADGFEGEIAECDEGELAWVNKENVWGLPLWEGDKIFLGLLQ
ncbi:MAG: 8-oxo-dGTP diphosphatase, partial [Lachnospiraceae bacterium]|nr:8-oxo-dGTP diphosphatase [Lachnospiraceae bacterium]